MIEEAYPYSVPIPKTNRAWAERLQWLREQLGRDDRRWCASAHRYWFRHESDYMLYLLSWDLDLA